jgi:hypothetical protein
MDDDFEPSGYYLTNDPIVREQGDESSYHVVHDVVDCTLSQFSLLAESSHQQSQEILSTPTIADGASETFLGFQVVTVKILVTVVLVILVVGGILAGSTITILSGLILLFF